MAGQVDSTLAALNEQSLRYRAAEQAYQAALAARVVVQADFDAALAAVDVARRGSDQEAWDRASERAMLQAQDLQRMDRRVQEALDSLADARALYLNAMNDRLTVLLELHDAAATRPEAERIAALVLDLQNQYESLERSTNVLMPQPVSFTGALMYNPRDTPSRLSYKIELANRRIEEMQARIVEADERIKLIGDRIRLRRQSENFNSTLGRFDDTSVPVGPPGQSRSQGQDAVSDSTGVRTLPQTLEDQLEGWTTLRRELESLLQSLIDARAVLRSHLGPPDDRRPSTPRGGQW